MQKRTTLKDLSLGKRLTLTALFAALCCIGTVLITIPLPASGYFNTGDVFVLLSAWCLGPLYGTAAAAIGSAVGDLFLGYALYAPATLLIKGLDAFAAACIAWAIKGCLRARTWDFVARLVSAIVGELIMMAGYFLFECLLYTPLGAIPNLLGNGMQAICCTVCAVLIISALYRVKPVRRLFPPLQVAESKTETTK